MEPSWAALNLRGGLGLVGFLLLLANLTHSKAPKPQAKVYLSPKFALRPINLGVLALDCTP